jgi:hypothetical protein
MAPGIDVFSRIALGKETVKGTPVAPTRRFYGVVAGNLDLGDQWAFHEAENRSLRTRPARTPTLLREAPGLKLTDIDGIGFDDLVAPFGMGIRGGLTGAGAGADKTWTITTNNAGANSPESFSADVGDDVQNWRLQYVMARSWKIGSNLGELTKFEMPIFAQRAIKTAAAAPAEVVPVKIPGDLWTIKVAATFAGLAGASVQSNWLRAWSFEYMTGFVPRFYLDGNYYLGQHVETDITGKLSLTVESTALAVSEIVDKWRAGTLDFVRLKATGPTLGGSAYSLQFDMPIYWDEPKPIVQVDEGVNLYSTTARLAYDATAGKSLETTLVCSLAAYP